FCEAGISAGDITILQSPDPASFSQVDPKSALDRALANQVELVIHNPAERDSLAYLASSTEKKPIYLNRVMQDADVVLPVGLLRVESAVAYHGIHGVILPTYSDAETIARFRAPSNEDSDVQRRRRNQEASEAARLLGVISTIQIVPGEGDSILHVLAGSVEGVLKEGRKLCQSAWQYQVPQPAKLVVAGIEGSATCQTWENVARAVASALKAVDDDGVIAICSELSTSPGEALQQLATADDYETALHDIRRQRSADAIPASQILRALDHSRIFLLSRLEDEVVEELGLAPVSDEKEITRLSSRFDSCIVLSNAQYAEAITAPH
ncbi:MAG: lactate racemase domain-containing protein, partial [Planctomycetales bacterium]